MDVEEEKKKERRYREGEEKESCTERLKKQSNKWCKTIGYHLFTENGVELRKG